MLRRRRLMRCARGAAFALSLAAVLLPARAAPASGEIPVLIAAQAGADGKPLPILPTITALVGLLAQESKLPLVVRPYPWRRAQAMATQGEGLLLGAAATPERQRSFLFTQPLYNVNQYLVVAVQRPFTFQRWEDLRGKTISIPAGAHYMGEFEALRDKLFRIEENSDTIVSRLKMLDLGRVDAVLRESSRSPAATEARINCVFAESGRFRVLDKTVAVEEVRVAVPRTGPHARLLAQLNEAIERIVRVQGFQKIIERQGASANCP